MATGVVALSFAKRSERDEPGPVNINIADAAEAIIDELTLSGETVFVVSQWEPALRLEIRGYPAGRVVTPQDASIKPGGKRYLDTGDVVRVADPLFKYQEVEDVVVVANSFIHLWLAQRMVRKAGFNVIKTKMPWVGFDPSPENLQWWTKGPVRFITYLGIQVIGKLTNRTFNGIGERQAPPN